MRGNRGIERSSRRPCTLRSWLPGFLRQVRREDLAGVARQRRVDDEPFFLERAGELDSALRVAPNGGRNTPLAPRYDCRRDHPRAAGERLAFHAPLIRAHANALGLQDLDEVDI